MLGWKPMKKAMKTRFSCLEEELQRKEAQSFDSSRS